MIRGGHIDCSMLGVSGVGSYRCTLNSLNARISGPPSQRSRRLGKLYDPWKGQSVSHIL